MPASRLVNRNVTALRGRTSMRLEPELWDALGEICQREQISMGELVKQIEATEHPGGRTSAVRVYVLGYFRAAANDQGHQAAGHGPAAPRRATAPRGAERAILAPETAGADGAVPGKAAWTANQALLEAASTN